MPALFHVSDGPPLSSMSPRPAPAGSSQGGRPLVWAVDGEHLVNYLLPRECPRVCWVPPRAGSDLLGSPARRVIAIECAWLPRLTNAVVRVHELDPTAFHCLDETAGYWVAEREVAVRSVQLVDDCPAALTDRGAELRVADSLWPYVDAVVAAGGEFSVIRIRNATARAG